MSLRGYVFIHSAAIEKYFFCAFRIGKKALPYHSQTWLFNFSSHDLTGGLLLLIFFAGPGSTWDTQNKKH